MTWRAWLGAAAIGLSLGLPGPGGSILTVPILQSMVADPGTAARAAPPQLRAPALESLPATPATGHHAMNRDDATVLVPEARRPAPRLLTGGQPGPEAWAALREAGVTRVVNLRTAVELQGRDAAAEVRAAGLDYVAIPVDGAAGVTPENADALWDQVGATTDGTTLVHCASGNRVGALLALGAARAGAMTPEAALDFGHDAGLTGLETRVRELLGLEAAE